MAVAIQEGKRKRINFGKIDEVLEMPNLIEIQRKSYDWFLQKGLLEMFEDISPIQDFTGNLILEFIDYSLGEPKYHVEECKDRDVTYSAPLRVRVRLINKDTGEVKEQEVFMGDFPLMTEQGTFIINGAERVIVSQLVRSPERTSTSQSIPVVNRFIPLVLSQIEVPGSSSRWIQMILYRFELTALVKSLLPCLFVLLVFPVMLKSWIISTMRNRSRLL